MVYEYEHVRIHKCVCVCVFLQEQFNGADEFLMLNATSHHQIWNSMLPHGNTYNTMVTFGQSRSSENSPRGKNTYEY